MHIAICDDNIADRKQLERLLDRESDRRKNTSGVFFCDSYGNSEHLSRNPMPYELFFLDMTSEEPDGLSFAIELRRLGVTAPIALCSSSINYQEALKKLPEQERPADLLFIDKPIKVADLTAIIDEALHLGSNRASTIELRSDRTTIYAYEDDIAYVTSKNAYLTVHLTDGRDVTMLDTVSNFYSMIKNYKHLVLVSERAIINAAHVQKMSSLKVTMDDGKKLTCPLLSRPFLNYARKNLTESQ